MLQPPDSQSFSRFLASAGFFLCLAPFVGLGVILRETQVLELKRSELAQLTRVGRAELERRQRVARDVAEAAPVAGVAIFAVGLGLILYAAPSMRRREVKDEQRSDAELETLRNQLSPTSEAERGARAEEEVAAEIALSEAARVQRVPGPPLKPEYTRVQQYIDIERRVLDRIAQTAGPVYELRSQVRLKSTGTLLDGVLVSVVDQLPDVVIEIKLRSLNSLTTLARSSIDETLARVARYRAVAGSAAVGWLILVSDAAPPDSAIEDVNRAADEAGHDVRVSMLTEKEIDQLLMPPGAWN